MYDFFLDDKFPILVEKPEICMQQKKFPHLKLVCADDKDLNLQVLKASLEMFSVHDVVYLCDG